ncbi:MAG: ATP-binding protein [Clostridiales bacterium]|jgi:anti-sigma regulatory factor (Ser/Thr protein kinase)|nr:ATP-binding protein [Clostridiales bacterium]
MTELSLNILDIANNSTRAGAKNVIIRVAADRAKDLIEISVTDDGRGMDAELLRRMGDPFATTRTTRKVGMGVPLFKAASISTGGDFSIVSSPGKGTAVTASFGLSHIDRVPLGDVGSTLATLIGGAPKTDFKFVYSLDGKTYAFDTKEVKSVLGETDLTDVTTLSYLKDMINENIDNINGGYII